MFYKLLMIPAILFISLKGLSQQYLFSPALIAQLDSIRTSSDRASHFAELYLQTTIAADQYIQTLPPEAGQLMKRLEENFAGYFFRAIDCSSNGNKVPDEWQNYFNGSQLSSLQLKLIGANAHINGDIWQALTTGFSLEEINKLKPYYKKYKKAINKIFGDLFESAIKSDKRLRDLHVITFGLDKAYAKKMLQRWRNRQLRLALFHFEDPERFQRLRKRVNGKRDRIDRMIVKRLG